VYSSLIIAGLIVNLCVCVHELFVDLIHETNVLYFCKAIHEKIVQI